MLHLNSIDMDSLPKQFVSAMRTLFDIMDDKQTGYVKLTDIENRWRDDRTKGLPRGVIESLQKVASHDGLLTFECFCTGLKLCLLRNQVQRASNKVINVKEEDISQQQISNQIHHSTSVAMLEINSTQSRDRDWNVMRNQGNTSQQRTNSMPQLIEDKDSQLSELLHSGTGNTKPKSDNSHRFYGPPKPPRLEKSAIDKNDAPRTNYNSEGTAINNCEIEEVNVDFDIISRTMEGQDRGLGDGRSANETQTLRRTSRRREPRRHTLHNGIDYNLLKRMKQIEQEKDILLQGLNAVEEAREWYLKQLADVQEKMRYAGRMGAYVEPWNEAHQERLELLRARVLELNRQLSALAAGWRHGPLSLHMNLALPASLLNTTPATPNNASVLRSQNRLLAEEVNRKNERISVLEREKSALIRELLNQRNRTKILDTFN